MNSQSGALAPSWMGIIMLNEMKEHVFGLLSSGSLLLQGTCTTLASSLASSKTGMSWALWTTWRRLATASRNSLANLVSCSGRPSALLNRTKTADKLSPLSVLKKSR